MNLTSRFFLQNVQCIQSEETGTKAVLVDGFLPRLASTIGP